MAYQQLGLIQASDYNALVDTNWSTSANTLNAIWSGGQYDGGYGQTAIPQVSTAGTVTATQWASLINTLNSVKTHQTGTGTGISATTAGGTINYLSTLQSSLSTAWSSRLLFNSVQGTTTTGTTYSPNYTYANAPTLRSDTIVRTITFASADQARWFFNAGGQINFIVSSCSNGDGTNRSGDIVTLVGTNFASLTAFRAHTNGGRSGTGGTVNTNNTSLGYYEMTTSPQTLSQITSTTSLYTGDYMTLTAYTNGTQGLYQDRGSVLYMALTYVSALRTDGDYTTSDPQGSQGAQKETGGVNYSNYWYFNDSLNVTINHRIDVVYPETTNISNTWGTVTVS